MNFIIVRNSPQNIPYRRKDCLWYPKEAEEQLPFEILALELVLKSEYWEKLDDEESIWDLEETSLYESEFFFLGGRIIFWND